MAIVGAIAGTAAVLALAPTYFGWEMPPWAKAEEMRDMRRTVGSLATAEDVKTLAQSLDEIAMQVAANTEAGFLRQLENAFTRGDWSQARRLCDLIKRQYGFTPTLCNDPRVLGGGRPR